MKEYKVLQTDTPEESEQLMNIMAAEGWSVIAVTQWEGGFLRRLVITLEREV